eukprot:TCONS_00008787-protein
MNATWPNLKDTKTFKYQHFLGQHVIRLFKELKLIPLESDEFSDKLQICLKKLVEFCKHVLSNKKAVQEYSSKKIISRCLSNIKHTSLELSKIIKNLSPLKEIDKTSLESPQDLIDVTALTVETLIKVFYKHWNKESQLSQSSVHNMDKFWNFLDKDEDTLSFDFNAFGLAGQGDETFYSPKSQKFIPLEGDYAHSFDTFNTKPSFLDFYHTNKVSLVKHNSRMLLRSPKTHSVKDPIEIINNGTELIESAHKVLLESQKKIYSESKLIHRGTLKSLRKDLNEALMSFDVSTTSLIENMSDQSKKDEFMKCGSNLLDQMDSLNKFIEENKHIKSDSFQRGSSCPLSPSRSDTSLGSSCISLSPRSTVSDSAIELASYDDDLRDYYSMSPGHPMNTLCFEEISKRVIEAATSKNSMLFEKVVNEITDFQEAMKNFIEDERKRNELQIISMPSMEKAVKTSREFIRNCRSVYRSTSTSSNYTITSEQLEHLKAISRQWCKHQIIFVDEMWRGLAPWTSMLEPIFALKKFHAAPSHLQNTLSNEWLGKFQELMQMITDVAGQFEYMNIKSPTKTKKKLSKSKLQYRSKSAPNLEEGEDSNDDSDGEDYLEAVVRRSRSDVTDEQIKVHNLTVEMKQYFEKIVQLTKLYLLGDIEVYEWMSFGLWLFRWANAVHNLMYHIDSSLLSYHGHAFTLKRITREQEKWKSYGEKLKISIQDVDLISTIDCLMRETKINYDLFKEVFHHSTDPIDMKKARLILLVQQWKLKIEELAHHIKKGTNYLAKPLDTLIELSQPLTITGSFTSKKFKQENSLEVYQDVFMRKMERVRLHTCLAVDKAGGRKAVHSIIEMLDNLEDSSDKIVNLCRNFKKERSTRQLTSKLFLLQIDWQSEGNNLLFSLRKLSDVKYSAVSAVMRHLLTEKDMCNPHEFIEVIQQHDQGANEGCTKKKLDDIVHGDSQRGAGVDRNNNRSLGLTEDDSIVYDTWIQDDVGAGIASSSKTNGEPVVVATDDVGEDDEDKEDENVDGEDETNVEEALKEWLYKDDETLKTRTLNSHHQTLQEGRQKPPLSPKPKNYRQIVEAKRSQFRKQHDALSRSQSRVEALSRSCSRAEALSRSHSRVTDASLSFDSLPASRPDSRNDMHRSESRPKSLAAAARILQAEAEKWEEENNSIIKVAKLMADQMTQMADFHKGRNSRLKTKSDFVATAKAIAANAKTISKFAAVVAQKCPDKSCQIDLLHYAELIPTMSTQLRIVASVKSINVNDETTDAMLVINAGNLMKGVAGALKAAESASVKISTKQAYDGGNYGDSDTEDVQQQSCDLAFQWKRKVRLKRAVDAICSPRDELGLRLSKETSLPSLTDLVSYSSNTEL